MNESRRNPPLRFRRLRNHKSLMPLRSQPVCPGIEVGPSSTTGGQIVGEQFHNSEQQQARIAVSAKGSPWCVEWKSGERQNDAADEVDYPTRNYTRSDFTLGRFLNCPNGRRSSR